MSLPTTSWPLYFLAKDPVRPGRRTVGLKAGDPFPIQSKEVIRGFGPSFGEPAAFDKPWDALDYVTTVNVHNEDARRSLLDRGCSLQATRDLLGAAGDAKKRRRSAEAA